MRSKPTTTTTTISTIIIEGFNKAADEAALRAYKHRKASDWSVLGITALVTVVVIVIAIY